MSATIIPLSELKDWAGRELGVSDWHDITQQDVNTFADVTHDHQWIHVDVERAKRESPFGGPIAHGYFTLSLIPHLTASIWDVSGTSAALNYGLNKLRFPAPVLIGTRIRARAVLDSVDGLPGGGAQTQVTITIESEGGSKPVCVAEALFRYYG
ncbi:MAG: MaoC family dehydratase [Candidatus Hydrogenedentes bacterium]|nr:MaoC family dehydratase [Candidatus Hydrogenedentota bacterium]